MGNGIVLSVVLWAMELFYQLYYGQWDCFISCIMGNGIVISVVVWAMGLVYQLYYGQWYWFANATFNTLLSRVIQP